MWVDQGTTLGGQRNGRNNTRSTREGKVLLQLIMLICSFFNTNSEVLDGFVE